MPVLYDNLTIFLYYHFCHFQLVCFQSFVLNKTYLRHDIELGLSRRWSFARHHMNMDWFVVVGVELESESEEYEQ